MPEPASEPSRPLVVAPLTRRGDWRPAADGRPFFPNFTAVFLAVLPCGIRTVTTTTTEAVGGRAQPAKVGSLGGALSYRRLAARDKAKP